MRYYIKTPLGRLIYRLCTPLILLVAIPAVVIVGFLISITRGIRGFFNELLNGLAWNCSWRDIKSMYRTNWLIMWRGDYRCEGYLKKRREN